MARKTVLICLILLAAAVIRLPAGEPLPKADDPASEAASATAAEVNEIHEVNVLLERARLLEKTDGEADAVKIHLELLEQYIGRGKAVAVSEDGILYRTLSETIFEKIAAAETPEALESIELLSEPKVRELLNRANSSADPIPALRMLSVKYPFSPAAGQGLKLLAQFSLESGRFWETIQCYGNLARFNPGLLEPKDITAWFMAALAAGSEEDTARIRNIASRSPNAEVKVGGETLALPAALKLVESSASVRPDCCAYNSNLGTPPEGVSVFSTDSVSAKNPEWMVPLSPQKSEVADSFPAIAGNFIVIAERREAIAINLNTGKRLGLAENASNRHLDRLNTRSCMPLGSATDGKGRVFFVLGWCNLYAFDARGDKVTPLWKTDYNPRTTPFGDFIFASLPVASGGRVYVVVRNHVSENEAELYLTAFSADDGKLLYATPICTALAHKRALTPYLPSTLAASGDKILIITNSGIIGAARQSDGEIIWLRKYERLLGRLGNIFRRRRNYGRDMRTPPFIPRAPMTFEREWTQGKERLTIFAPSDTGRIFGIRPDSGRFVLDEPRAGKKFLAGNKINRLIMYAGGLGDELTSGPARRTTDYLGIETRADAVGRSIVGYNAFELVRRWHVRCPEKSPGFGIAIGNTWYIPGGEILHRLQPRETDWPSRSIDSAAFKRMKKEGDAEAATMHILAAPGKVILFSRYEIQCFKAIEPEK
ncbi:MAG: PQQ-binding-like beta-propeller repeat protein [Planctomycetota bacterium]|jgi:hypothetical protein